MDDPIAEYRLTPAKLLRAWRLWKRPISASGDD